MDIFLRNCHFYALKCPLVEKWLFYMTKKRSMRNRAAVVTEQTGPGRERVRSIIDMPCI